MQDSDDKFIGTEPTAEDLAFVAQSYAMRQVYWPDYTWGIQTKQLNVIDDKMKALTDKSVDVENFKRRKSDLFDKINASFYHLQRIKENEASVIELGKKMAKNSRQHIPNGVLGIVGVPYEPINYEYEALLVSLKTGMDIIAAQLAEALKFSSKVDDLARLIGATKDTKQQSELLLEVKTLLTKHCNTIDEFSDKDGQKSKRNFAVHKGSLPTGTINIQYAANHAEVGIIKTRTLDIGGVEKTDFTKQQNLDDYSDDLFYAVCDFIIEGLELLLELKLSKGTKASVYEAMLKKKPISSSS